MPASRSTLCCLGLVGLLGACDVLGPPAPLPDGAMRLTVPAEYQAWWSATEACSGQTGQLNRIEWYVVPDAHSFETPEGEKVGLWTHSNAGVRIIIAGDYADNELVVRHEMLHALLDREGHPEEYFQTRCQLTWDTWGSTH